MSRPLVPLTSAHAARPWATARYLRRLVDQRRIAFFKIGGRIWFDPDELDRHAEASRVEAVR